MPGLLLHLAFGKMIYDKIGNDLSLDKADFLSGCLIPDMTTKKKLSHYRVPASITSYLVPDMNIATKELLDIRNSLRLGLFCHLFLDYHFFENYIFKKYKWENTIVTVPTSGYSLSEDEFFSRDKGIYQAYGELNSLLLNDGKITYEDLDIIPLELPFTNISRFDERKEKGWRDELNEYFITKNEYSGKILDYQQIILLLDELTNLFIKYISNA